MIIAGDGYNNIRCADSLNETSLIPAYQSVDRNTCSDGLGHLILTNPPFGTSEAESLTPTNAATFPIQSTRGQSLFIQKMIQSVRPGSLIVTVIDEGVLNTATHLRLREFILKSCAVEAILSLPNETFKPNKINVRSSVLVLRKREETDEDLKDSYPFVFISIESLGYEGSGDDIRGFDLDRLITEVTTIDAYSLQDSLPTSGYYYSAFSFQSSDVIADKSKRLDVRYWHPQTRTAVSSLGSIPGTKNIHEFNTIETGRGKSPPVAEYVSASEGYALVVKSGSNITKTGELISDQGDYIEFSVYQDYEGKGMTLLDGDILLASTGSGTLGKCCVYRNCNDKGESLPAVPEGHVTVLRVDQSVVHPEFLCDYLRKGFGHDQIQRIFTGSTGMIEITPEDVDSILVPKLPSLTRQKKISSALRAKELEAAKVIEKAARILDSGENKFRGSTTPLSIRQKE